MRSLVEVCAEARLMNWREADEARELRERLAAQGRRIQEQRRAKGRVAAEPKPGQRVDAARLRYHLRQEGRL